MIIVGLGGHAREVVDIIGYQHISDLIFFEEVASTAYQSWKDNIKVVAGYEDILDYLVQDPRFVLGVGKPVVRKKISELLLAKGGKLHSAIANTAVISVNNVSLEDGLNIMHQVFISANAIIKKGALINTCAKIHHDCYIGEYTEISPNVTITGGCSVGTLCSIGAGAVVIPGKKIGNNVVIGAGAVVTTDIPDNSLAVGVPAKVIKTFG